jgi:hypothetical protein
LFPFQKIPESASPPWIETAAADPLWTLTLEEEVYPLTKRSFALMFVEVVLVPVAFVQVRLAALKGAVEVPPANWIAFVVVLPLFVTVCRFAEVLEGQFVPFVRHTVCPVTKRVEPDAELKFKNPVDVTFAKFVFQRSAAEPSESTASAPGIRSVVTRPVTARFVPVPFTKLRDCSVVVPVTAKSAVDVPPANWMAFVVVLPLFVTDWKVGETPDGQFVPFARHTRWPVTKMSVEVTVARNAVPEA